MVGAHLLLHLVQKKTPVIAIHRKSSDLEAVKKVFSYYTENSEILFNNISWIEADLNDIPALEIAFKGVTHVYHCAALISFDPNDYEKLLKTNVEGTANVVNLCLSKKIQKLCYVSSIAAIGKSEGSTAATEENEWNEFNANVYALSKHSAEMEVWRGKEEGLSVVIVNPGVILGPGFWHTGSGILFKTAFKGLGYYPPGTTGFISVTDVIEIMVRLMESSVKNERFILICENWTYKKILSIMARELGKSEPTRQLQFWQLQLLWRLDWFWSLLSQKSRKLTKVAVASLKNPQIYSNKKITDLLHFKYELLEEVIYFSCNRFREENL